MAWDGSQTEQVQQWVNDVMHIWWFYAQNPIKTCSLMPSWTWRCRADQLAECPFSLSPHHEAGHVTRPRLKPPRRERARQRLGGDSQRSNGVKEIKKNTNQDEINHPKWKKGIWADKYNESQPDRVRDSQVAGTGRVLCLIGYGAQ